MKKYYILFITFITALFMVCSLSFAEELTSSSAPSSPAEKAKAEVPAPVYNTLEEKLEQNVSISFTKAELKSVLSFLAKAYSLNMLVDDEIKGTVSIVLKDVTLEKALTYILNLNDFIYVKENEILEIKEVEEDKITGVIDVNFVDTSLATEIVQKFLSEDASIQINDKTDQLIITDTASKIEEARDFLKKVDLPPRQVVIEAKLLDVTHYDYDNLGISWSGSSLFLRMPLRWLGQSIDENGHVEMSTFTQSTAGTSSDLSGSQFTVGFSKGGGTLTATIDALIQQRKVKVLANPTITTINNVEAKIVIGEKYPIREQTQTTTGTLETTRFVDIGTTLVVTPRITEDGFVQITIHPEVSSVASTITDGPRITTREADMTVVLKDRQSVVLAGLISENETLYRSKIPILGYLPFIGTFFSSRHKSHDQKELVIIITPYILPSGSNEPIVARYYHEEIGMELDIEQVFQRADDMIKKISLKARNKDESVRYKEAAMSYTTVAARFPLHYLADDGLYKAGMIYFHELKDYSRARDTLLELVENYPKSEFLRKAKSTLRYLNSKLKAKEKKLKRRL